MSPKTIQRPFLSEEFLKPAVQVALHYGFRPSIRIKHEVTHEHGATKRSTIKRPAQPRSAYDPFLGEFHSALQTYLESGFQKLPQPVMFYHSNVDRPRDETLFLGLHVLGSRKSVAEAILIKTALDILDEAGVLDLMVHLNTVGDKESMARYGKELALYFRKNIEDVPVQAQKLLKRDPIQCLAYLYKKSHPLAADVPQSIEFLSEQSRTHFREVLEFLEMSDISYIIDNSVLGQSGCHSQLLFEIREIIDEKRAVDDDAYTFARGGRYDDFSRQLYRMNIPAVGILLESKRKGKRETALLEPKRIRQPKVYFIQFGFEAKLRSLRVLEMLRRARVPIHQSLGSDKLVGQLQYAERLQIPYTIIMGHKEALEGTVIVRDMNTRSQNTIAVDYLPEYLRTIV